MKIGIQMWSIKDLVEKEGMREALKFVKQAGFDGVEFAGFYGNSPLQLKEMLEEFQLEALGAHLEPYGILVNFDEVMQYVKILDMKTLTNPAADFGKMVSDYDFVINQMQEATNKLSDNGVVYCYHNHDTEYENGKDYVKKFLNDVNGLGFEADVFWLQAAGMNAIQYMKDCQDKVQLIHIKEMSALGHTAPNPIVGEGVSFSKEVIEFAKKNNIPWVILESENYDMDIKEYVTKSCVFMKNCL